MKKTITLENIMDENFDWSLVEIDDDAYIPLEQKMNIIEKICQIIAEMRPNGFIEVNYITERVVKNFYFINLYTNIELDEMSIEVYDKFERHVMLGDISLTCHDWFIFEDMLDLTIDSYLKRNSMEYTAKSLQETVNNSVSILSEKLGEFLDKGDPNKIAKYLSKGIETLGVQLDKYNSLLKEKQDVVKEVFFNVKKNND